jgi:PIN domain nuclease of toxin-antitoxin system
MRLLLDTHAFLWWATDPDQLSTPVLQACMDPDTTVLVSLVSAWELQIKAQLGKLHVTTSLDHLFRTQERNGVAAAADHARPYSVS